MTNNGTTPPSDSRATASGATHNRVLGAYGEALAARHLVEGGMVLLARNVRGSQGEVDLLLREGSVLVACEVKTRSSCLFGTPHQSVDAAKVARVRAVAEEWASRHRLRPSDIRVDLVAVLRPRRGRSDIEHIVGLG